MKSRFDEMAEQLASLNLQIKHDIEQAEAKVERVNQLALELGRSGLLARQVILGVAFERPYDADSPLQDSGQIIQAVLRIPEGLGVCVWDMEEFVALQSSAAGLESRAGIVFQPYDACGAAEKRFVVPFLEEMLEDLTDVAMVAASKLEPEGGLVADEYFSRRQREQEK
jgi:hypothetical protein